jgi:hypothetical protein
MAAGMQRWGERACEVESFKDKVSDVSAGDQMQFEYNFQISDCDVDVLGRCSALEGALARLLEPVAANRLSAAALARMLGTVR